MTSEMSFCAGLVARNEGTFLRESVESVLDAVDEVIIVENGSIDETKQIGHELAAEYPKVRFVEMPDYTMLADARNRIDDQTGCDWILWWDADFIAWSHDEAPDRSVRALLDRVRDRPELNQVLYGGPNVGPSFDRTDSAKPYQGLTGDTQITRKGFMRFTADKFIDTRYYTAERKCLHLNKRTSPFVLHLDKVKPLARIVLRDLLYRYDLEVPQAERSSDAFRSWVLRRQPDFSLHRSKEWVLRRHAERAQAADVSYPKILAPHLKQPYFEWDGTFRQVREFPGDKALDGYFENLGLG